LVGRKRKPGIRGGGGRMMGVNVTAFYRWPPTRIGGRT
jgi:hypothetical protein